MSRAVRVLLGLGLLASLLPAQQGRRHDPLTEAETDQVREVADDPNQCLKLYVKFARARMLAIEQVRSDPRFLDERGTRLHNLLGDFGNLVDEIDDHVAQYLRYKNDARAGLKELVEADADFLLKLRGIKEQVAAEPKLAREAREYQFVLDDTLDSVGQSADSAREALEQQNRDFAKKKKDDKKKGE